MLDGAVGIGGFAAALYPQTDRPFAVIHRQDIAGVEAEHMFRRMAAEVVAFSARFNIVADAVAVGAAVEGVACVNLPTVGQAAGNFGVQAAAALIQRFPIRVRTGIDALVVVVLVGAVEGDGSIQTTFVPFAFPTDFVVAPHNRRQQVVVVVAVHRLFEDGCIGGVNALFRCNVVSDAGIGDEAVAFERVIRAFRAVFEVSVPIEVAVPVGIASADNDVQFVGRIDARAQTEGVSAVAAVAAA